MKQLEKTKRFREEYELEVPIIMAPMAGACPPALAAAVSNAGGMGACGALMLDSGQIKEWTKEFKFRTNGSLLLNTWVPGPEPTRDYDHEKQLIEFLSSFAPGMSTSFTDTSQVSFEEQCQAMLDADPNVISSIMGLFKPSFVSELKKRGIKWFATVTSVSEAIIAEEAGADALVVQGSEAGGHRGNFCTDYDQSVGLMALLPTVSDAVNLPIIATGGIADSRGVSAAIMLGASAFQIGTGLLRTPEADVPTAWADALQNTLPEDTVISKAFTGKPGRAISNQFTDAAGNSINPVPAPFPIQRSLTAKMRSRAVAENNIATM
ncbi:MAG: NAD(P)H-dependent flavin oxidoreductase [Candidatus Puniceispirillaceae bacterium]